MHVLTKTRRQKLADATYQFCNAFIKLESGDYVHQVLTDVLTQPDPVENPRVESLIIGWAKYYPEEEDITLNELIWVLSLYRDDLKARLDQNYADWIAARNRRVHLRTINGGLHQHPDKPVPKTIFDRA